MPSTSRPVRESRAPVGSSARITAGSPGQGPGDGHPLLLAAGELAWAGACSLSPRPTCSSALRGPLVPLRLGDAGVHQGHLHVLQQGQLGQQVVLLEDEAQHLVADGGQLVVVHLAHVPAVQQIGAGGGHVQAADDVHAGGLAGAGLAHDGHELPLLDLEGDVVRRLRRWCRPSDNICRPPGIRSERSSEASRAAAACRRRRRRASRRRAFRRPCPCRPSSWRRQRRTGSVWI